MDSNLLLSDEELAHRCISDMHFLGELISRYEGKLGSYVRRKSNATSTDIQDILQNIFIKVYKNLNDFDSTLKFSSWIYRIAHNEMIDWYRKEKRTPRISLDESIDLVMAIASETNITEDAIKNEKKEEIKKAIELLPNKYQEIIELRFFEEKSYEEIADILKIPQGTVAIRLNRVKKVLHETLKDHE